MKILSINIFDLLQLKTDSVFNSSEWISIYDPDTLVLLGIFNKNNELKGVFYYQKHHLKLL